MSGPVVVVGAGITGLSAAYQLRLDGAEVVVLEASDRVGGAIAGSTVGGVFVESGPDGFLARRPEMANLCRELGLGADLVAPAASGAFIWADGALRPIPAPSVLGVPLDADSAASSGLVSDAAVEVLRAGLDQPAPPLIGDAAVGEALRPRLGDEVFERLVDPLLGGINGGSADAMSLAASAPRLHEALRQGGPLGKALRAGINEAVSSSSSAVGPAPLGKALRVGINEAVSGPVLMGVRGGTTRVTAALAKVLKPSIRTATPVTAHRAGPIRLVAVHSRRSGRSRPGDSDHPGTSHGPGYWSPIAPRRPESSARSSTAMWCWSPLWLRPSRSPTSWTAAGSWRPGTRACS